MKGIYTRGLKKEKNNRLEVVVDMTKFATRGPGEEGDNLGSSEGHRARSAVMMIFSSSPGHSRPAAFGLSEICMGLETAALEPSASAAGRERVCVRCNGGNGKGRAGGCLVFCVCRSETSWWISPSRQLEPDR